jgi:predicted permease
LKSARLRGAAESDIVEELAQHMDDRYDELRARGTSDDEARRIVLDELEDGTALGDGVRATLRVSPDPVAIGAPEGHALSGVLADIRVGARVLRRAPAFTLIATLVVALGIGANTAVFSVVNALLLRPLPGVRAPSRLVSIYTSDYSGPRYGASSLPDGEAMRASGTFSDVAVHAPQSFTIMLDDRAEQVLGEVVSADYFGTLGARPAAGRFFVRDEAGSAGSVSVVVSHAFWQERLHGAPDVIGSPLRVNGQVLTIIGITAASFRGMMRGIRMDLWLPVSSAVVRSHNYENRGNRGFMVTARLPENVTIDVAQERLDQLATRLHEAHPSQWTDINEQPRVLTAVPESDSRVPRQVRGPVLGMLALLMTVVGIVLFIACSNVANLMLARASARRAEMGVRLALGATRGRIVRQLLAESLLLAGLGGTAGVLLAFWLTRALQRLSLPVSVSIDLDIPIDIRVIAFAVAITILTGVLFGLAPALHGSRAPAPLLKDGVRASSGMRVRNALVVVQVAASVVLLTGGALFLRSLMAAQRIDTGIHDENVVLIPVALDSEGFTAAQAEQFFRELRERLGALPGVTSVTLAERVPLSGGWARRSISVEGHVPAAGEDMEIDFNGVSDGYFEALGIRFVRGRGFTSADRLGAPDVVVVNEAFARRFWPGMDPIGRRVGLRGDDTQLAEVVGLVPDAKYRSLTEEPRPFFYYPYAQRPAAGALVHVRTAIAAATIAPRLREAVHALAPSLPVPDVVTLSSRVAMATLPQRIAALVLGVLGVLALGTAALGLYGVISYAVVQRTSEFGIRAALGAAAGDVLRMVVGQGLRLTLAGIAIGTVLALALARLLTSLLLVSPADPLAILAAAGLLMLVAALASWIPARRAMRLDPLTALRSE